MEKIIKMEKKGINSAKALIVGGVIVLLSTLESETMIPWYIKVAGGFGLTIYGISQLIAESKERNK